MNRREEIEKLQERFGSLETDRVTLLNTASKQSDRITKTENKLRSLEGILIQSGILVEIVQEPFVPDYSNVETVYTPGLFNSVKNEVVKHYKIAKPIKKGSK